MVAWFCKQGLAENGNKRSLWGDGNLLKLDLVVVAQLCKSIKNHWIDFLKVNEHLKWLTTWYANYTSENQLKLKTSLSVKGTKHVLWHWIFTSRTCAVTLCLWSGVQPRGTKDNRKQVTPQEQNKGLQNQETSSALRIEVLHFFCSQNRGLVGFLTAVGKWCLFCFLLPYSK